MVNEDNYMYVFEAMDVNTLLGFPRVCWLYGEPSVTLFELAQAEQGD